jgi:hypothetical protein
LQKQCQSFRCDFWIGQDIFDPSQLGFWQEKGIWLPVEQAFVKHFLGMNAGTEDPNCGIGSVTFRTVPTVISICDYGGQKWLSRLDYVGKFHGPSSPFDRLEVARDSFARRDALQKFR